MIKIGFLYENVFLELTTFPPHPGMKMSQNAEGRSCRIDGWWDAANPKDLQMHGEVLCIPHWSFEEASTTDSQNPINLYLVLPD